METKVESQLRSDLILCLSSDSMRTHPEIPHKPHLLSIRPCSHAIPYRTAARPALQRQQGSALMRFYGEKCGRHEGWDWSDGIWRRSREMTALRLLSVIDLWWICLVSALFKHERVLWWSLPDDDLHDDISLPADHVAYKTPRGVLTRTTYPPCILRAMDLMSWLRFPSHISPHIQSLPTPRPPGTHHFDSTHGGAHMGFTLPVSVPAYVHKWTHALTSVHELYATYRSVSVSERKQVPLAASKVPLITLAAIRQTRPADGTVCL